MNFTFLIEAIIVRAAEDYFDLLAGFIQPTNNCNIAEIEAFFYSDYYAAMTRVDPDLILNRIKEEAAKMVLEYTVSKEKGSSQYYVCRVGEENVPLSRRYTTKKKALHKAAEMQGVAYDLYMKIRRRDCV